MTEWKQVGNILVNSRESGRQATEVTKWISNDKMIIKEKTAYNDHTSETLYFVKGYKKSYTSERDARIELDVLTQKPYKMSVMIEGETFEMTIVNHWR